MSFATLLPCQTAFARHTKVLSNTIYVLRHHDANTSIAETKHLDLLSLQWPQSPRNILIVHKNGSKVVDEAVHEYANHIHSTYPDVSLIFEPKVASTIHDNFSFPIYTTLEESQHARLQDKVDLT